MMVSPPQSTMESAHEVLSIRNISKQYNGIEVLSNVDLQIKPGEVLALLGENGAGKSTLSSIIAGVVTPTTGTMQWLGKPYAPKSPREAIGAGVGLIHQEMKLLPDLSIAENIFAGRLPTRGGVVDRQTMHQRAAEQLERLGLDVSPTRLVRTLRVAAQQQVEIAKALILNSRLLILDEPTAALGSDETDNLFSRIEQLRDDGVSFIYISHRLEEIARIADRIVVLRDGQLVATHDRADVPVNLLIEQMVGRTVDRIFPTPNPPQESTRLSVKELTAKDNVFREVSFEMCAGEILGIAGIVGSGRTELVRAIAGADSIAKGSIVLDGKTLELHSTHDAIQAGIVLVPEDRKQEGLVLEHTLADNLAIGNFDLFSRRGWVLPTQKQRFAKKTIGDANIKGQPDQKVQFLSGGNQQKVVIARWVPRDAKVFILDEPTRGIDVGARAAIYDVIHDLARAGVAVIVVSSDLDEVIGLSHRVLVLSRGECKGILTGEELNHQKVMELATL